MLSSIHPLGERTRNNRWWITAAAFVVGSVAGGAAAGGLMGLLGAVLQAVVDLSPEVEIAAVVVVLLVGLAFDARLGGLRLPSVHRQVNENWLTTYRGWVYGVGFGVQLGLGVVTIVTTAAVYAWWAIALLSGSVLVGLAVGTAFGLVRGLAILPGARITDPSRLRAFHRRLVRGGRVAGWLTPAAEVMVVVAAVSMMVLG